MAVEVTSYHEEWRQTFEGVGALIRERLADAALRIDHIGSTSVVGLPAKPIVDVQVTVRNLDVAELVEPALRELGLHRRGGVREDRPPPWETPEPREWLKLYFRTEGTPRVHVHVRESGRRNQRYPLLFRDYLRANSRARDAYGAFKTLLAAHLGEASSAGGTGPYLTVKEPVLDVLFDGAERWAQTVGWQPGPSDR